MNRGLEIRPKHHQQQQQQLNVDAGVREKETEREIAGVGSAVPTSTLIIFALNTNGTARLGKERTTRPNFLSLSLSPSLHLSYSCVRR